MVHKCPCVYILAIHRNGTLYIGVTSDLVLRIWQHRSNAVAALSGTMASIGWSLPNFITVWRPPSCAKSVSRNGGAWKLELIERHNPEWWDLYDELAN